LKLHPAPTDRFYNTVTAYGDGYVEINEQRYDASIIVLPEGAITPWPVDRFETLDATHFSLLLDFQPEIVVFGSGARLRFPHPHLLAALTQRRIGVETMDLHAACRTYNILMAEGRRVAAALLIEVAVV